MVQDAIRSGVDSDGCGRCDINVFVSSIVVGEYELVVRFAQAPELALSVDVHSIYVTSANQLYVKPCERFE